MYILVVDMQETNYEKKVKILDFLTHKITDYLVIC